jgi:predicted metal-binding protein
MVNYEELKELALSTGFSHVGDLDADTIQVHTEVREACAADKCHAYNKNWVCPPACGTLDECSAQIHTYKKGLILQTTGELEDSFDFESMKEIAENHGQTMHKFADKIKELYPNALILGDGACNRCKECTYPDAPCRFPDRQSSAMEAYGMVVSEVCQKNNIKYYYGDGTLTYVGCVLLE